ncbi:MAG: pyridoxamine 5'-phosphate oxidase family protein [Candidatus Lokiarchaeota archaeon]|jgi:nitroimidazol reductase NimA-like FMN-containing flavoprotein (pyridoxamine 5'-phosphate oxidase superfamily)|nr:pyridoxamine 5'-phosphate oxidase family protein [Candidatus Lokiarchaeota archaeon]
MVKIKLPEMTDQEVESVLSNENICRIAFIEDSYPYICPFQYVYLKNQLYFHLTNYGKKMRILKKNNNVCVSIEKLEEDLSSYSFISIQGKLVQIEDKEILKLVIREMVDKAKGQFSRNFLAAHGFRGEDGWESLIEDKLLIYKLEEVGIRIGLKSY